MQRQTIRSLAGMAVLGIAVGAAAVKPLAADEAPGSSAPQPAAQGDRAPAADDQPVGGEPARRLAKDPPGMIRLLPDRNAWIDAKHKRVVMDGVICLRQGQLEMFACPKNSKEHESIVSVDVPPYVIHAALVRVGAQPGTPVEFQPEFKPASGPEVEITAIWTDAAGKVQRKRAQDLVRNLRTQQAMSEKWVFAGSGFWVDDATGERHYAADGGYFICLSNFGAAMLDIPIHSEDSADNLLFECFTERLPPLGTPVRLVLTPKLEPQK